MRVINLFAVLALVISLPTWAHKVIFDVFPSGTVIEGELGFSNGDMAVEQLISIENEAGLEIGQVYTDSDGFFSYTPNQAIDHVFIANLGAGHVAKVSVGLADMDAPAMGTQLAPVAVAASTSAAPVVANQSKPAQSVQSASVKGPISLAEELQKLSAEMRQMRRELKSYKEKNDLQTILGGIGYILGLVGLAYYLAARRKLKDL